ncbi:MarR family transcriptional regulator [Streptomyces sp. Je 1-79]|uniref:MarR family winged helix-turn-helix transcriptional regulator n=1 Tax=Streptomyces sp. Je 1-79 TaxID=2943847 RepID=UPI0021A3ED51|nr:MarR family transcriptional regulator [Streptomyces sp. Je 1-79]MCT4352596.1 MarR family transcriptional regulator [Streptomyces sp. Je 1-79]
MAASLSASSDQVVWSRLLVLHSRVERELAQALQRRHGIGLSEYRALESLSHAEDSELRMQDLADRVGLGQSSVTRLVARLEVAGFAYKDLCPSDKRGVYAVITAEGRERHAAARATYADVLSSALNALTADPEYASTVQSLRAAGA